MGSRQESNMPLENHITSGKSCYVNAVGEISCHKLNVEVGTSVPGSLQDHDEVIVWQGKDDMLGGEISEPLNNLVEMSNPNVKVHESLPLGSVLLSRLLRESKIEIDSGGKNSTSKQKESTVSGNAEGIKDHAMDKNEQTEGIGGRAPGKEEMKQTGISGIQVEGKEENQLRQSGNCGIHKGLKGKSVQIYDTVGVNERDNVKGQLRGSAEVRSRKSEDSEQHEGMKKIHASKQENKTLPCQLLSNSEDIVKLQVEMKSSTAAEKEASLKGKVNGGHKVWRVKAPLGASRTTKDGTHTCHNSEGPPLKGVTALTATTESPNQGGESFDDAKARGDKGNDSCSSVCGKGNDRIGEIDSKHDRNQDVVLEEDISVTIPFHPKHYVKDHENSIPPGYLESSKLSAMKKEVGSKIYISKQQTCMGFTKFQGNIDSDSVKYKESWNSNTGSEDGVLDRNEGIKYKAPDKEKQMRSGKPEVSNGQNVQNNKKGEAARKDTTVVNGRAHNIVEISSMKSEQQSHKKELGTSKERNKNGHKEPVFLGISTFLESVNAMEREMSSKHAENQVIMLEENGEGGICVCHPFLCKNGRPRSIKKGAEQIATVVVVNNGKDSAKLFAVKLANLRPSNSFSLSHTTEPVKSRKCENIFCLSTMDSLELNPKLKKTSQHNTYSISLVRGPWLIEPSHHLTLNLSCKAKDIGLLRTSILFDFQDQQITQHVTLLAEDDVSEQLAPVEPYSKLKKGKVHKFGRVIHGAPPPLPAFPKKLKAYNIPHNLEEMGVKKVARVFERGISMKTYSEYFSALLYLEELQLKKDMSAYDMHNANMRISGQYLVLKVPGLSEKRPSLVFRDQIYVTPCQAKDNTYQGYIHRIEANEIYVKFNNSFHKDFIPGHQYNVQFSFCRTSFRRCHKAVESACRIDKSFLFPSIPLARTCIDVSRNESFNRHLNKEQLFAVHQIVNRTCLPPYLIYGPPGTGKTATLVEAILQVLKSNAKARILACAPSNVASDLLVERLIGPVQKREIFRLNAISRPYKDVSHQILPYCYYEDSMFLCPPLKELLKYKIIISTFLSASILDAQGLRPGHFTHIFLDESGQGTEPETMVPIANLANTKTIVVLAGDPQQLGPLVLSPIAAKFGLGKSYLERLSQLNLYALDGGNNQFVTKLVRNYRSHPAILELPSQLFYGGTLIACAANEVRNLLSGWDELSNKKFPIVFFGIEGCDEREGKSPSWFNTIEVSKVLDIVKKLKDNKRNSVIGKDIGVITPYRQQVVKLKKAFAANALPDVKIGSVEQFQGDEKLVIIISTVRSSYKNEEFDKKYNLGFIGHPRRFNVAVTRAKSLLVVVGNPYILSKDRYWNELLQYCVSHKSYIGCMLPPKNNGNEFTSTDELLPDEGSVDYGTSRHIGDMEWPDSAR